MATIEESVPSIVIVSDNASMKMSGETVIPLYYFRYFLSWGVSTTLIVHDRCKDELRESLSAEEFAACRFCKDTKLERILESIFLKASERIYGLIGGQVLHLLFDLEARKIIRQMTSQNQVDVVFQPTPISPKMASGIFSLGVPVAVGPLCGGLDFPPAFRKMDSWLASSMVTLGRAVSRVANRLFPGRLRADIVFISDQRTKETLPAGTRGKEYMLIESGVEFSKVKPAPCPRRTDADPARFVFCGRFVDWKGVQYLVEAFAKALKTTPAYLDLIGDGALLQATKDQVKRLGIEQNVVFHGRLPLEDTFAVVRKSDAFMSTGLREARGIAMLEAMAAGTPIVASDWLGPGEIINESCGIKVPVSSEKAFVDGLAEAMIRIASDSELRNRLSQGAIERAQEFAWEPKARKVLDVLTEFIGKQERPKNIAAHAVPA